MQIQLTTTVLSGLALACAAHYHPDLELPQRLMDPCEIAKKLLKHQMPNVTRSKLRAYRKKQCGTFFWQGVLLSYIQNGGVIVLPVTPIKVSAPHPYAEIPDLAIEWLGYKPELKPGKSALKISSLIKKKRVKPAKINPGYSRKAAQDLYVSEEWRRLRYDILREQHGCCQLCGRSRKDGVVLHVDHIIPLSKDWSKRLDRDNLQVLCEDCNLGKSNTDEIDWR